MVMKLSSSGKKQITFSVLASRDTDVLASTTKRNLSGFMKMMVDKGVPSYVDPVVLKPYGKNIMTFTGQAFDDGTKFTGAFKILTKGGKVYIKGDRIFIKDADQAILIFSCATNYYHGQDWEQDVINTINAASKKSYTELLENHLADYQKIFQRIEFDLDGADRDPQLYALHFQYGRYLLISSSRKGYFPPGYVYWCPDLFSEWFGGHADDINQQMNYWMVDVCDMPEMLDPFFDVLDSYVEGAKGVAKYNYGSRGMMISGFTPYGMTGPHDIWPGLPGRVGFPAATAWYAHHYWEHYLFTLDEEFLKNRAYPFIKEAALFYLDYLAEDPKTGNLVSFPDFSPEGPYINENGEEGVYAVGTTLTLAVCRELFANFIQASTILGVDEKLRKEVGLAMPKIEPYRIGKYGQLQEWAEDHEDKIPGHRHVSHLYPVHPGYEINPYTKPELAEAAKQSLIRRRDHIDGYGYVGWSRAWFLNISARLQDSKIAHEEAKILISKCTYPNMLDTHQMGKENPDKIVNCIDGNFGYTAGIAEILLHSHLGFVHLLPALPKEKWPNGYIKGLKARGGYTVDVEWKNGELSRAIISSNADRICSVRYKDQLVKVPVKAGIPCVLNEGLQVK
jgi:alpha-L-fucosidase 2